MIRIFTKGSYLYIIDVETGAEISGFARNFEFLKSNTTSTEYYVQKNGEHVYPSKDGVYAYKPILISEMQEEDGTNYTASSFETFKEGIQGFSTPQEGGVTQEDLDLAISNIPTSSGIPLNQNRFVCTVNNSQSISEEVSVISIENYTDVIGIGSIATFNGSNLSITALAKDLEVTAKIDTIGDFPINRQFYFRDINDPINVDLGDGVVANAISSYGTYGSNSSNIIATATLRAGTTVTLNLINQSSIGNQKIKAGSFIQVKEI